MILRWLNRTELPVEMEGLTPGALLGLTPEAVARSAVRVGNQDAELADLFSVHPDGDAVLSLEGDLRHVRGIGRGMEGGTLVVRGRSGPHLGAGMSGGTIEVHGDADDWAGAAMRGGVLRIRGAAGRFLGAAYPGARLGMREGVILVDGDAGAEAGRKMRRGLIAVGGSAGEGFGRGLVAGSLFAFGPLGRFAGAGMKRGTIAALGAEPPEVLPSFAATGCYQFPFLAVYLRRLAAWGFRVPADVFSAPVRRYNGDLADGGRGEILVRAGSNES